MDWQNVRPKDQAWQSIAKKIDEKEWEAAHYLAGTMRKEAFNDWEGVIAVFDQEELAGFCSYVKQDIVETLTYTPYIATVYVDPKYRGQHLSQALVSKAEEQLIVAGFSKVYIVSQHQGLYERMDYKKIGEAEDIFGRRMVVYRKELRNI
ncbi:GNAT family N-acetyltransferase [Candidatus Enterococcus clewellii]|uniref:N-acetyltransferase domain-containing protein n=1 Tax=Candidatus Enterococcus clewellii TaxID=1834193 RepID=A0A242KCK0_9ENTE|nr:GNAT family N-acetyltransferase [Enterococcus sp. 9E7_DIV0242]OTP18891.1 hypothetical protein A5888_000705 [Enterococcus sp. 9E7_DIV0242]